LYHEVQRRRPQGRLLYAGRACFAITTVAGFSESIFFVLDIAATGGTFAMDRVVRTDADIAAIER